MWRADGKWRNLLPPVEDTVILPVTPMPLVH
jgi:hypothetical protein